MVRVPPAGPGRGMEVDTVLEQVGLEVIERELNIVSFVGRDHGTRHCSLMRRAE